MTGSLGVVGRLDPVLVPYLLFLDAARQANYASIAGIARNTAVKPEALRVLDCWQGVQYCVGIRASTIQSKS